MAFDITTTFRAVESHLKASGRFAQVFDHEPTNAADLPDRSFAAAIWVTAARIEETTLTGTIELHVLTIRIYRNMFAEPLGLQEIASSRVASEVADSFLTDFTLGGTIRAVDVGQQYGTPFGIDWGFGDVSGTLYRMADIQLPLIVDGTATFAP